MDGVKPVNPAPKGSQTHKIKISKNNKLLVRVWTNGTLYVAAGQTSTVTVKISTQVSQNTKNRSPYDHLYFSRDLPKEPINTAQSNSTSMFITALFKQLSYRSNLG